MQAASVNYSINISNPNTHYATVTVTVSGISDKFLDFKMPVWAPGSYLVREFARNVEQINAIDASGNKLPLIKTDKNTWRVTNTGKNTSITLSYELYANEPSVRTSIIDSDHAFLHNSSVFMFVNQYKNLPGTVKLIYPAAWKNAATSMDKSAENTFSFADYDILADSPIEIGNHESIFFEVMGVPHKAVFVGANNCDKIKFTADLKKLCETMAAIVGVHPSKNYTFIIQNVEEGGGGLEHLNSCTVQMPRYNYSKPDKYLSFLGLCAHEYFHLWNVKRIRPKALGPFNYNAENHTHLLWVAEGITSYYDELALYRSGYWTRDQYLSALSSAINGVENRYGSKVQPLADASWDAWIKEYRPNENSINTTISYYSKGQVVAAMLDIEITASTKGAKNLDDVLKYLYKEYYLKSNTGFTDEEFTKAVSLIAGKDMKPFMDKMIFSTEEIDYKAYFAMVGAAIIDENSGKVKAWTGINSEIKDGRLLIKSIEKNSPASKDGFSVGDEIIAVNSNRIKTNLDDFINEIPVGTPAKFLISRAGLIKEITLTTEAGKAKKYVIKIDSEGNAALNKWLSKN